MKSPLITDNQLALERAIVPRLKVGNFDRGNRCQLRMTACRDYRRRKQALTTRGRNAVFLVVAAHNPVSSCCLARSSLSWLNLGWKSRSWPDQRLSASPLRDSQEMAVESISPLV